MADPEELEGLCDALAELVAQLEGCQGFVAGPNRDFEGKSIDFPYGFTLDAENEAALERYAQHPRHKVIGAQLVALCEGGVDGITVFDLEISG